LGMVVCLSFQLCGRHKQEDSSAGQQPVILSV
jgi:hypothetical protein